MIQHLMATRLLPAVKRYALGTEPVREAAKAAQVPIPTLEDDDLVHDEQTQSSVVTSEPASVAQSEENLDVAPSRTPSEIPTRSYDVTASESSFMPTNAVSSTPARPGHARAPDRTLDDQPSWSASLESPMDRLKSELQSFAREEEEASARQDVSSLTDSLMYEEENTIQQLPPMAQEKTEKRALPGSIATNPKPRFSPPIFLRVHCRPSCKRDKRVCLTAQGQAKDADRHSKTHSVYSPSQIGERAYVSVALPSAI
ncbi:hypothetical protein JVT61DRAFT_5129 [Boletus reticuloceps]|uniref:Uncharacterized protein n=1 Tax=Boletus reticuloceps TaxID=495285 RepID=A0A8I3ACV0_9AGAM|nr:hypothetical protein JVT61DRAFT_5129 [Boletus reticuloceps]